MTKPYNNPYVTCPCCWEPFLLSQVKWIAASEKLRDDRLLDEQGNETEPKRFHPERFTLDSEAIDDEGERCKRRFACPDCHMEIPYEYFGKPTRSVAIVGTRRAGKTYFLTALHHRLAKQPFKSDYSLDWHFETTISNVQHEKLAKNVSELFRNPKFVSKDKFARIDATIQLENSRKVKHPQEGDYHVAFPFIYKLQTADEEYALCFHDYAGETFLRNQIDNSAHRFIKHIRNTEYLFFLYDPIQNEGCIEDYTEKRKGFRDDDGRINEEQFVDSELSTISLDQKNQQSLETCSQIFGAMAAYLRAAPQKAGLCSEDGRYTKHISIIVTKFDTWGQCLNPEIREYLRNPPPNYDTVVKVSDEVRGWLEQHDPEFTSAVNNFANRCPYIPVSATGRQPMKNKRGEWGYDIGERALHPLWIEVPLVAPWLQ